MCGIAGKIYLNNRNVSPSMLLRMSDQIAHRGPDDEGTYISPDKKVGLANRRLAIIDLTQKGHQPMSYKDRYIITFNGEIYNFPEEKKRLEAQGYTFSSNTDTEVILALFDKYKFNCLLRLRGMFAFAIYDRKENTLFLARDRLGKKPLKYYRDSNVFIFSSELKSILTQEEVKSIPDYTAVDYYLTYGYVPSPMTGFENIYKLEPGHYIVLDIKNNKFKKERYWDIDFKHKQNLTEGEWCELIINELEKATKIRMIADVGLGALLSGGVDSSTVVSLMSRFSSKPVKTFTIGFKEKEYDEAKYAQIISKRYHTEHTELIADPESVEIIPDLVYQYEEPFADSSAVITYMVSRLARKYVTVILTGDGGDENFAGYPRFCRLKRDVFLDKYLWLIRPAGLPLSKLLFNLSSQYYWQRIHKFLNKSKTPLSDRFLSYNCYFKNEDRLRLFTDSYRNLTGEDTYKFAREKFREASTDDPRDRGLYFELTGFLPESQLTKVDIASMSVSLEARSPFLDHKLVELVAQIPYDLKVKSNCQNKYILKRAVESLVPRENLYRSKMGFTIPLSKWFTGKLNDYTKSKILGNRSHIKNIIKEDEIRKMLSTHTQTNDFGPQLWSLLTLELWFQRFFS